MLKKTLFFVMFSLLATFSWCENIFVYIEKGVIDVDEEKNKFNPELLNVMEDGIMDSFF